MRRAGALQLFLLLDVVFFLVAPRLGLFRYGIGLDAAAAVVAPARGTPPPQRRVAVPEFPQLVKVVRRTGWTAAELQARFNAAVEQRTRSMVSLHIAILALLLLLAYAGRRRYLAEHVVFATHYCTLALVYIYLAVALRRAYGDRWPLALLRAAFVLAALSFGGGLIFYVAVTAVTARTL